MTESKPMSGTEMRVRRQQCHLSQEQLAGMLGVKQATVSRWESEWTLIPAGVDAEMRELTQRLIALADVLHRRHIRPIYASEAAAERDPRGASMQLLNAATALYCARAAEQGHPDPWHTTSIAALAEPVDPDNVISETERSGEYRGPEDDPYDSELDRYMGRLIAHLAPRYWCDHYWDYPGTYGREWEAWVSPDNPDDPDDDGFRVYVGGGSVVAQGAGWYKRWSWDHEPESIAAWLCTH